MTPVSRCHPKLSDDEHRDYHARYYRANRLRWRRSDLARRYNLTPEAVAALEKAQGGRCAVCGDVPAAFVVDHDHRCCPGKETCGRCIRALLCLGCNVGLGHFRDDPARLRAAAEYLERRRR